MWFVFVLIFFFFSATSKTLPHLKSLYIYFNTKLSEFRFVPTCRSPVVVQNWHSTWVQDKETVDGSLLSTHHDTGLWAMYSATWTRPLLLTKRPSSPNRGSPVSPDKVRRTILKKFLVQRPSNRDFSVWNSPSLFHPREVLLPTIPVKRWWRIRTLSLWQRTSETSTGIDTDNGVGVLTDPSNDEWVTSSKNERVVYKFILFFFFFFLSWENTTQKESKYYIWVLETRIKKSESPKRVYRRGFEWVRTRTPKPV